MWISKNKYESLIELRDALERQNIKYGQLLRHIEDCRCHDDRLIFDDKVVIISEPAFMSISNDLIEYKRKYEDLLAHGIDSIIDKLNSVGHGYPVFKDEIGLILNG